MGLAIQTGIPFYGPIFRGDWYESVGPERKTTLKSAQE